MPSKRDLVKIAAYRRMLELQPAAMERMLCGRTGEAQGTAASLAASEYGIGERTLQRFARMVKDNPNLIDDILYHGATTSNPRSSPSKEGTYGPGWSAFQRSILIRDHNTCVICGLTSASNVVHHIDSNKRNNVGINTVTLCPKCHGVTIAHPNGELNAVCKFIASRRATIKEDTQYE